VIVDRYPFWHAIIDDFFVDPVSIANEFPTIDDPCWFRYDNPLEVKQTCNNWHSFGPNIYKTFQHLLSQEFADFVSRHTDCELIPDLGLHGGGLHQHGRGGKLNVHLDYNLHPKLHLQRRLNLIVYLSPAWQPEWGGGLGLYQDSRTLAKVIEPKFNRAVIFDTRGSWHGLPDPIQCPAGVTRNSIAVYYLSEPAATTDNRKRALFAPTPEQMGDPEIERLIKDRVKVK
jgi:Rps23 Pro-64 3,4-dihydroxylase Tpa1-like proline 4-hydroxylase